MPYKTGKNSALGVPVFTTSHDNRAIPVGDIHKAYDDVLGEGEFIFLPGVVGCLAGDVCAYDLLPGAESVTRLAAATAPGTGRQVVVALNDCGAGQFGWFQKRGNAIANAIAGTVAGSAFLSATTGALTSTDAANVEINGMRISSAVGTPSAGKVYVNLDSPSIEPFA